MPWVVGMWVYRNGWAVYLGCLAGLAITSGSTTGLPQLLNGPARHKRSGQLDCRRESGQGWALRRGTPVSCLSSPR
ncbi:Hypp828 [Branchiostoma lanceolatum]|uniref:Hypp828 protein n=1 Tax=Branchiostoma lanceolatum TaxID=7740 RepID=A0A8J9W5J2_BRALA|nr:Hypp828 [Branchiostoma lanceolatum]